MEEQGATTIARSGWTTLDGNYRRPPHRPNTRPPRRSTPETHLDEVERLRIENARLRRENARLQAERDESERRFQEAIVLGFDLAEQRNAFIERLARSESARKRLGRQLEEAQLKLATAGTLFRRDRDVIVATNEERRELQQLIDTVRNVLRRIRPDDDVDAIRQRLLTIVDAAEKGTGTMRWNNPSLTLAR